MQRPAFKVCLQSGILVAQPRYQCLELPRVDDQRLHRVAVDSTQGTNHPEVRDLQEGMHLAATGTVMVMAMVTSTGIGS